LFAFLPVYRLDVYPVLNVLIAIFPVAIAYAIFKHQLMDIRVVIQRGLIYSVSLSIFIGIYVMLLFVLGFFFQQTTDATIILAAMLTTILGIYSVPVLEKYFRKVTDKIFFKDKYDYSQAVYELSEILNQNIELGGIIKKTITALKHIYRIEHVIIYLVQDNKIYDGSRSYRAVENDTDEYIKAIEKQNIETVIHAALPSLIKKAKHDQADKSLIYTLERARQLGEKHQIAASAVIMLEKKLIGIIGLGARLSGDGFSAEDMNLLNTFSKQAAVALEKAQLYQQVRRYSGELEEMVKKRTSKIKGLQEEQKEMMQEISHGLQTPLTILRGELDGLSARMKKSSQFASLNKSIDRVSKFIYDMLRLANLEATGKDFKKEKFNLSQTLRDLIEDYAIITQDKNIKLEARIEENVEFMGDQSQIEELVTNLVSNSTKYMKGGRAGKIGITLEQKKGSIILKVTDNGIGISEAEIPYLFFRFHRVKDKDHAKQKGTGLGLAISQEIVTKHDGRIEVKSEVGRGTSFIISLPGW